MSSSSLTWEPSEPGEELGGVSVHGWITPKDAGLLLGHAPRTLERWRLRGLPSRGRGPARRYPLPHLIIWARAWHQRGEDGADLSLNDALELHFRTRASIDRIGVTTP